MVQTAVSQLVWRRRFGSLTAAALWLVLTALLVLPMLPWLAIWPDLSESRRAWYALIENFFPFLAFVASVVALAFLMLRRRRAAVLAGLALAMTGLPVLAGLQAAPAVPAGTPTLKVMTFNLWVRNQEPERLVAYLRQERPDVVFLQEVTERHKQALAALLDIYPTQVTCHTRLEACETMLLSRYPARWQKAGPIAGAMPSAAIAELDLGAGRVTAVAVHLEWPFPHHGRDAQREQVLHLVRALDDLNGPLIIGGDFNGGGWIRNQRDLRSRARLTGEPGLHPSWPAIPIKSLTVPEPFRLPIDHVLSRDGPAIVSAETGPELGSDHLPILAEIAIAP